MRRPSRDSRTTEQKSPVVRDTCSAMMASRASVSGTASLNAADAAAIAAKRLESSPDTRQLYSGVNRHEPSLSGQFARKISTAYRAIEDRRHRPGAVARPPIPENSVLGPLYRPPRSGP